MGSLYENIMRLCDSRGITGYRLCKDIGLTPGALTDLKMGRKQSLSAKNMEKVASYFGVSIDYLLTGYTKSKQLYFANGVSVYQNSFHEALERELQELDTTEYRVVAKGVGAAVVVATNSSAPQSQIDQIVSLYIDGNNDKIEMLETEKAPTPTGEREITDDELKFALWGDCDDIDEDDLADVRSYAAFVRERKKRK